MKWKIIANFEADSLGVCPVTVRNSSDENEKIHENPRVGWPETQIQLLVITVLSTW